jgi:tight adherence protein C
MVMVNLLIYPAFLCGFVATVLIVYNLMPIKQTVSARGLPVRETDASILPLPLKLPYPLASALSPLMKYIAWPSYRERATILLRRAGILDVVSVDHLFAYKIISAIIVPLAMATVFEMFRNPALFVATIVGGFLLPDQLVKDMKKKRERAIVRALPGSVDVLSLSVEAGLEFLMAIRRLVERGAAGPLRDELATILNDIRLGETRANALKAFAKRVEIPEVSSFVSVLVQADALGASIGPVLQQQAERMRVERFQRAEKEGAKASQKILFPLVLCIFPAVLIVILGPVALNFIYGAR